MSERVALYPGSFDPITLGHLEILERAAVMFDIVVVAVLENAGKSPLFTVDERVALIRECVGEDPRVRVGKFIGLTVDAARGAGATAIVRGLRAVSDFENEFQMEMMNRRLAPEISTVFFMTSVSNVFISSSVIKEVWRHGASIEAFVPPPSAAAMRRKLEQMRGTE